VSSEERRGIHFFSSSETFKYVWVEREFKFRNHIRVERDSHNNLQKDGIPMITRRKFIAAALVALVLPLGSAMAQGVKETEQAKQADFLFVQTAKSMSFDKSTNKLTLVGVSSTTLFFSDRPERIAGNMKTAAFVPFWSKGKDSFLKDPPNADVSILEGDKLQQVVVVLQSPALKGDTLVYSVKVLQGDMPAKGADVSIFIDIIGMPLTPMSYAGVARRGYRRAVWR
jgi:hypothetical protein